MTEPTGPRLALLVGAPRSGTTWLQGLLGAHPRVASPQETDLFARFLEPLEQAWAWQTRGEAPDWIARRLKGLPSVLRRDQFRTLGTDMVRATMQAVVALKPGADVVLEKSPIHALHLATAAVYAPDFTAIHLIRDGRDVAASLVAAAGGWGSEWAPGDITAAARLWVEYVTSARAAAASPASYVEVRFETLRSRPAETIAELFATLDLSADPEQCAQIVEAEALARDASGAARSASILVGGEFAPYADRAEPEGFYGSGEVGSWTRRWSLSDRVRFAEVAAELLIELGYESDDSWIGPSRSVGRIRRGRQIRAAAARTVRGAGARLGARLAPER